MATGDPKWRLTWDIRVWEDVMTEKEIKERTFQLQSLFKNYGMLKCELGVMDLELAQATVEAQKRDLAKEKTE
jgi:hypothetical protein